MLEHLPLVANEDEPAPVVYDYEDDFEDDGYGDGDGDGYDDGEGEVY